MAIAEKILQSVRQEICRVALSKGFVKNGEGCLLRVQTETWSVVSELGFALCKWSSVFVYVQGGGSCL